MPDPLRLAAEAPEIVTLDSSRSLFRVYFKAGEHPTSWSQLRTFGPISRFDHQKRNASGDAQQQERGVLYAATSIPTALAETFQRRRRIDRTRRQPWLAAFRVVRPIRLLDLPGLFCVRAGASAKLITGPFRHAQNWSAGFYDAYPSLDGLYYRSSLTNDPTVVLYERAASAMPQTARFNRALVDASWHGALVIAAQQIGYEVV